MWPLLLDIRKKFSLKFCQILKQTINGSGGVFVPGDIQNTCKGDSQEHGLMVDLVVWTWYFRLLFQIKLFYDKWFKN